MIVPSGLSQEDALRSILKISSILAERYTFGYYEADDIRQEATIIGMEAVSRFDPSKASLDTFLYHHISNRLKNFIRDHYVRSNYICKFCGEAYNDSCKYCIRRKKHETRKRDLMHAEPSEDSYYVDDTLEELIRDEVAEKINRELPVEFRCDYLKWRDGIYLPKGKREKLEQVLYEIIHEYT